MNKIILLLITIYTLHSCDKERTNSINTIEQYISDSINQDISDVDTTYLIYGTWNFIKEESYDSNWNIISTIQKGYRVRFVHGYMLLDKNNDNIYDGYYKVIDNGDDYDIDRSLDNIGQVKYYPYFKNLYSNVELMRFININNNDRESWFLER